MKGTLRQATRCLLSTVTEMLAVGMWAVMRVIRIGVLGEIRIGMEIETDIGVGIGAETETWGPVVGTIPLIQDTVVIVIGRQDIVAIGAGVGVGAGIGIGAEAGAGIIVGI